MEKNNRVKKLADNPYYAMSDKDLEELADLLKEEARMAAEEENERMIPVAVTKNRVAKNKNVVKKVTGLEEESDVA